MEILADVFGPAETNSYILLDHELRKALWIDPAPESAAWVCKQIKKDYILDSIWITHSHWDHIADIAHPSIKKLLKADPIVFVHGLDAENIRSPGHDGLPWPREVHTPGVCTLKTFADNDTLTFAGYNFRVLHTPGHSLGSSCFLCLELNLLISGDTLFAFGYGRVDIPGASPKLMRKSLQKLQVLSHELQLLPGHGPSCLLSDMTWLHERFG